jgi:hypothetical protein
MAAFMVLNPNSEKRMTYPVRVIAVSLFMILRVPAFADRTSEQKSKPMPDKWTFIQSVGGIKIGQAYRAANGHVWLPVKCDVSGLMHITTQPIALNSGLVVKGINVKKSGREIRISVITSSMPRGHLTSSYDAPVKLGKLDSEPYSIFYDSSKENPPLLGKIRVPLQ